MTFQLAFLGKESYREVVSDKIRDLLQLNPAFGCALSVLKHWRGLILVCYFLG
jgi:hypothetical protein